MDRQHDHEHHEGDPGGGDHRPKGAQDDFDEAGRTATHTPEGQGDIVPEVDGNPGPDDLEDER